MRNTADLVNEMLEVAKTAWLAAIAVGFHDDTKFVFSSAKQPLKVLNQYVQEGGFPIGILKFEKEGNEIQGMYRPFLEYENVAWAEKYLADLLENTEIIVASSQFQE